MMMKIKTNELSGDALDWAAQHAEIQVMKANGQHIKQWWLDNHLAGGKAAKYSSDWCLAGPIIERERITLIAMPDGTWSTAAPAHSFHQPTSLIAAMRCYVASKLGQEVEMPESLS